MAITEKDLPVFSGKGDAVLNARRFIDAIGHDLTLSKAHWMTCALYLWGKTHEQVQRTKRRRYSELRNKLWQGAPGSYLECLSKLDREYHGHCGAGNPNRIAPDWHHGISSYADVDSEPEPGVPCDHTRHFNHRPTRSRVVITQPYSVVMFPEPTNIVIHGETTDLAVWDMPARLSTWNPGSCIVRLIAPWDTLTNYLRPALQHLL